MRIRQHVNPKLSFFDEFRGERPALPADRPLEVEIGCADAQFLFERAAADPGRSYVGLEIREELVELVNKRARTRGLPVTAVFCQAQKHLDDIFAPASIDRVYINFPDPWFKRRHADRRMVDDVLVAALGPVTRPGEKSPCSPVRSLRSATVTTVPPTITAPTAVQNHQREVRPGRDSGSS